MVININNKEYSVNPGKNLLETCLSLGFDIPYFCFHPALGSVGACRLCAVKLYKDENDKEGKIIMSCMEPVKEGMRISTEDKEVIDFRDNIIESLMINHPHDCPVCDEGGECHLQDMTVMTGHTYRRYDFKKRTYRNQDLGPFINHEMNRCIQCFRCVRYYRDYAGGRDLNVFGSGNRLYFGRAEDGKLESDFSGNLVEVCPTGVFTDKTFKKHYTRKWDLTNSPSICTHCSLGCNIIISERYGKLRRVLNRYNSAVNGYFICDKGRFDYEFVNSDKRIKNILLKDNSNNVTTIDNAKLHETLKSILQSQTSDIKPHIIGIGSAKASLESNYTLKELVGSDNFYSEETGQTYKLNKTIYDILKTTSAKLPSLKEVEKYDAVLILGEDISITAPMSALSVRQAVRQEPMDISDALNIPQWNDSAVRTALQNEKGYLCNISEQNTKIDDIAEANIRLNSTDIAKLGNAIADSLENISSKGISEELIKHAQHIAKILKTAKQPLIISGGSLQNIDIINAAEKIANTLHKENNETGIFIVLPDCNSLGLTMLGARNTEELFNSSQKIDCAIILENDLFKTFGSDINNKFLSNCSNIITLDYLENETTLKSHLVLPVATFAESNGTHVNNEGRAQRFYKVFPDQNDIKESWKYLKDIIDINGNKLTNEFESFEELLEAIVKNYPVFNGIQNLAPPAETRWDGLKVARQTQRFSGRTSINAGINVSEQKPPSDNESAMTFTMEGSKAIAPSELTPFYWSPGWNSVQALNKYQEEVGGKLIGGDTGKQLIINNE